MEKGTGASGGIGRHIDRQESRFGYNTFGHADPEKREQNTEYHLTEHCKKPLPQAISDRIKEGYKAEKSIRKDAVLFQTHILTGSHEEMEQIFSNGTTRAAWVEANQEWLSKTYGKDNIVRFTLHMDEKTPHIHAVTVPITSDGRLSAKDFANGKQALRELQSGYARYMEPFGLKRGLERTGIKHETAQEYYARENRITEFMEHPQIKPIEPQKSLFGSNIDEISEQNRRLSFLAASFTEKIERREKELKYAQASARKAIEQNKVLTREKDMIVRTEVKTELDAKDKIITTLKAQNEAQANILNSPEELAKRYNALKEQSQIRNRGLHM
jgi:hypothetical protein